MYLRSTAWSRHRPLGARVEPWGLSRSAEEPPVEDRRDGQTSEVRWDPPGPRPSILVTQVWSDVRLVSTPWFFPTLSTRPGVLVSVGATHLRLPGRSGDGWKNRQTGVLTSLFKSTDRTHTSGRPPPVVAPFRPSDRAIQDRVPVPSLGRQGADLWRRTVRGRDGTTPRPVVRSPFPTVPHSWADRTHRSSRRWRSGTETGRALWSRGVRPELRVRDGP